MRRKETKKRKISQFRWIFACGTFLIVLNWRFKPPKRFFFLLWNYITWFSQPQSCFWTEDAFESFPVHFLPTFLLFHRLHFIQYRLLQMSEFDITFREEKKESYRQRQSASKCRGTGTRWPRPGEGKEAAVLYSPWCALRMLLQVRRPGKKTVRSELFCASCSNTPHTVAPARRPPLFNSGARAAAPLHRRRGRTATDNVHPTQHPLCVRARERERKGEWNAATVLRLHAYSKSHVVSMKMCIWMPIFLYAREMHACVFLCLCVCVCVMTVWSFTHLSVYLSLQLPKLVCQCVRLHRLN